MRKFMFNYKEYNFTPDKADQLTRQLNEQNLQLVT
jgi:hypothetical protein